MHVPPRALASSSAPHRSFFRSGLFVALLGAFTFVLIRSVVFVAYEQSFFDSDQAIVGLMAKHLVEGRAFPLFYYGQTYMLGVDAWLAAPIFLVAGPTVGALHFALTLVNLLIAGLLVAGLHRWAALAPRDALMATVFFTLAPPVTARYLLEAAANICTFVYVLLLWTLRRRPLWWGPVLAIGFLHREFTIYALPVLALADLLDRSEPRGDQLKRWLTGVAVALAVWQGTQALAPYADFMGPGSRGELIDGFGGSQGGNIAARISLVPAEWPERIVAMAGQHLPRLLGTRHVAQAGAGQGHDWMRVPFVVLLVAGCLRMIWLWWRDASASRAAFAWYLAGVGLVAIAAYVATRPAADMVDRYLLLALLLPIGVAAVLLSIDPDRRVRHAVAIAAAIWAASSLYDHGRHVTHYASGAEPNPLRELIDELEVRGIGIIEADYWRAYKIAFLSQERVKAASTDFVRIDEYQELAAGEGDRLLRLSEQACEGGQRVSLWYLCRGAP
jgi:hypothetical protein